MIVLDEYRDDPEDSVMTEKSDVDSKQFLRSLVTVALGLKMIAPNTVCHGLLSIITDKFYDHNNEPKPMPPILKYIHADQNGRITCTVTNFKVS